MIVVRVRAGSQPGLSATKKWEAQNQSMGEQKGYMRKENGGDSGRWSVA